MNLQTASIRPPRAARRLRAGLWRDPRIFLGLALVLGSTVLGARVLTTQDEAVAYWSLRSDVAAGDPVAADALIATRVHLDGAASRAYVRTDEELAAPLDRLVWARGATAGSLVDVRAWEPRSTEQRSELPLSVETGAAPADLARGDIVDVWAGPGAGDPAGADASRVLTGVRVAHAGGGTAALEGSASRTVVVDVDRPVRGSVVGAVSSGHVTIVRVSR